MVTVSFCQAIEIFNFLNIINCIFRYSESNIDRPRSKVDNMFSILNIDPPLRTILNSRMPLWLTINDRSKIPDNSPRSNLERGLEWAQILGDASNSGFKRVFAQVNEHNFFKQTLTHYTMLLHKKLMGETVLDLETTRGDQLETHVYAHCAKNRSGAFTIFALNTGYEESLVTLRIPPMKAGSEYDEYILTMNSENGNVRLNDEDLYEDSPLIPNLKMRRLMRPISLTLPARSIGFWTFPEALLSECDSPPVSRERRYSPSVRTSSEKLLYELILEEIEREEATENNSINKRARRGIAWNSVLQKVQMNSIKQEKNKNKRSRRSVGDTVRFPRADKFVNQLYNGIDDLKRLHIHSPLAGRINTIPSRVRRQTLGLNSLSRLLEKMEFRKPNLLFKSKLNFKNGLIPPISTIHDIYEPNTPERAIFKSIENTNLPTGDVHMEIGDDRVHDLNIASMVPSQTPNAVLPVQHYEHPVHTDYYENTAPELSAPEISAYKQIENLPAGQYEMYEFDNGQSHVPEVLVAQPEPNVSAERNIDTIVPDNQPNWETDRDNYQKARENIQQYYVPNSEHTIDTILPNFDNKKISTFLPNLARGASIFNKPQSFDTRRKRRSIDSKMNDEIEEKVHKMESPDDEDETLFNKMAKMIMKNQENEFADAQLRCRIVSKSIEQRCLDSNSHPFIPNVKREMDESKSKKPYKEMKKKLVKSKTNEKNREKRSILFSMESNELADNDVRREIYEHLDNLKEMKSPYETKDDRKTIHVQFYNRVTEGFPRMVETVEKTVKDIAGVVRGQIFRIFESWY